MACGGNEGSFFGAVSPASAVAAGTGGKRFTVVGVVEGSLEAARGCCERARACSMSVGLGEAGCASGSTGSDLPRVDT